MRLYTRDLLSYKYGTSIEKSQVLTEIIFVMGAPLDSQGPFQIILIFGEVLEIT